MDDIIAGVEAAANVPDEEAKFQRDILGQARSDTSKEFYQTPIEDPFKNIQPFYTTEEAQSDLYATDLTPDQAAERALRYHFAMGDRSPGPEQIKTDIMLGQEGSLRDTEVLNRDLQDKQIRNSLVNEIIQNTGGAATVQDIDLVKSLTAPQAKEAAANPGTILEKIASEKLFTEAFRHPLDDDIFLDVGEAPPTLAESGMRAMSYSLIARRYVENQEAVHKGRSWTAATADFAFTSIVPFTQWYMLQGVGNTGYDKGFLLGDNLADTVTNLYMLPTEEAFDTKMKEIVDHLNSISPDTASMFVNAVANYTTTDKFLGNFQSAFDVVLTAYGPAKALLGRVKNLATAVGGRTNAIAGQQIAAATGGQTAVAQTIVDQIAAKVNVSGDLSSWGKLVSRVPSIFNPGKVIFDNQALLATAADEAGRLATVLTAQSDSLLKNLIVDPVRLDRLSNEQRAQAYLIAQDKFKSLFPQLNSSVINVNPIRGAEDAISTVDAIAVEIGSTTGKMFGSEKMAERYAVNYGLTGFNIKERGGLFYIQMIHHVDETELTVLNKLATTVAAQPENSFLNKAVGWFRSKEYTLPKQTAEDFGVAAVQTKGLLEAAAMIRQTIEDLPNRNLFDKFWGRGSSRTDFEKFLEEQQAYNSKTKQGVFSETLLDFEKDWHKSTGRIATEQEKLAYFGYKQLNDMDWVLRNLNVFKDKVRIGVRDFRLERNGSPIGWFEAKDIGDTLPKFHKDDAGVLVWDPNVANNLEYQRLKYMKASDRARLDAGGYRVLQLSGWGNDALKETMIAQGMSNQLPNARIHYLLAKDPENKVLEFTQIPYKAGGHRVAEDPWYLRQPNIIPDKAAGRVGNHYIGDTNIMTATSKMTAEALADKLNVARIMYRDALVGTPKGQKVNSQVLRDYLQSELGISMPDFRREFESGNLNPNTPIFATSSGQSTWKAHNLSAQVDNSRGVELWPNLENDKINEHNLYKGNVDLEFALARGENLMSASNVGDMTNPLFNYKRGTVLSPLPSMDRTVSSLFRGVLLDDLKRKTSSNFVELFKDVLDDTIDNLRANPLDTMISPKWKTGLSGDQLNQLAAAKNFRRASMEFMHLQTDATREAGTFIQKIADNIAEKLGYPKQDMSNKFVWSRDRDYTTSLRGMAFDFNLGLFNPSQYLLQAMTSLHVIAVEGPVRGSQATMNAWLTRAALINDKALEGIATHAMGMTKDQFIESHNMMKRLKWDRVGHETANLDDLLSSGLVDSAIERTREAGRFFFKEGDRYSRLTAWNGAYMRWRAQNPTATFTEEAGRNVLARANLLSVDMINSSNASWQKGLLSLPTQFSTYPIRLAEQLMPGYSNRLTGWEKFRAFTTYGAFFGIPVATAGVVGVWPIHEEIRKGLQERGIDIDSNVIAKTMNDGLLSMATELLTGTKYNIPGRFGPAGTPLFSDLIEGDKSFGEFMIGAAGSTFAETVKSLYPFGYSIASVFKPDDEQYPLTSDDFLHIFDSISTFSKLHKMFIAMGTGNYISKNGTIVDNNMTNFDAYMLGLIGVQPQRIDDAISMNKSGEAFKDFQTKVSKQVVDNMKKGLQAEDDNEKMSYFKRAKAWYISGGFRPDQASNILGNVGKDKSLVDSAEKKWQERLPSARDIYLKKIEGRKRD